MNGMTFSDFLQIIQPLFFTKIAILIILFLYFIFTIVVFTQVKVMNGLVKVSGAAVVVQLLSVLHIFLALSLFLMALVIL